MADTSTAQDLATIGLAQFATLSTGVLTQQVDNPTDTYPRRPWIDEPSGSRPFDPAGAFTLSGVVPQTGIVLTFVVPIGQDGVIKFISCNTTFPFNDFSGDLQWQLFVNGKAVPNFDNILNQKGSVQQPRPISPLRIYSGDIVQWVVNHLQNGALNGNVVCSINGYIYPSQGLA